MGLLVYAVVKKQHRRAWVSMVNTVALDLSDEERLLLWRGLLEWGGPARPSDAMAVAMGFLSINDLLGEGSRIGEVIRAGGALSKPDWRRALLATEIVFASGVVGSGLDWSMTTGFQDDETIVILRSIQRKMAGSRYWVLDSVTTSDVPPAPRVTAMPRISRVSEETLPESAETRPLIELVNSTGATAQRQQVKRVVEGLALGCLYYGILRLPNDRTAVASAFTSAWSSWPKAPEFNSVNDLTVGNDVWIEMGKSESRKGLTAAWERRSVPHLMPRYADDTVTDCLKLVADDKASAEDWTDLAESYLRALSQTPSSSAT
ncbi:hypothetical protein MOD31_09260 [Paenarthrobacter sp. TYUT067]|uniref:hypothetical protein n=2 Tax=unclassified Paenarthrobacter TaxID=2634190 RepID=UPI002030F1F3|nr:hypothetical protein [Paenarthrobacter sp. TYUT067]MCM0616211.1 hypothetical protein [Paenarthrobacter sp. TYUT067]